MASLGQELVVVDRCHGSGRVAEVRVELHDHALKRRHFLADVVRQLRAVLCDACCEGQVFAIDAAKPNKLEHNLCGCFELTGTIGKRSGVSKANLLRSSVDRRRGCGVGRSDSSFKHSACIGHACLSAGLFEQYNAVIENVCCHGVGFAKHARYSCPNVAPHVEYVIAERLRNTFGRHSLQCFAKVVERGAIRHQFQHSVQFVLIGYELFQQVLYFLGLASQSSFVVGDSFERTLELHNHGVFGVLIDERL